MIEFKIPRDQLVMQAMSRYLLAEAGGDVTEATPTAQSGYTFPNRDVLDEYVAKRAAELGLNACKCEEPGEQVEEGPTPASLGGTAEEQGAGPTPPVIEALLDGLQGAAPGVKLADGLPWDERIHSGSKATYSKPPHGWKLKRGVDKALVDKVEAELREALAASPSNPVVPESATEPDAATVFGGPTPPAIEEAPNVVAPTNFVELNLAITAAGLSQDRITAAVNAAGLQNYMLLPTRSDLIPFVAGQLGLGPIVEVPQS